MCGISGIINYNSNSGNQLIVDALRKMNQKLGHRGPDDRGIWVDRNVGFGHTRLSILDLSKAGNQPMVDPIANNVITFNGEIFNYRLINQKLFANEKFCSNRHRNSFKVV